MSPKTRLALLLAIAAVGALPAAGAPASPSVSAAFACSTGNLGHEFYNLRARGMTCRAARRAVKRGKFTGGSRFRFTTRGFHCVKLTGNYSFGRYKCRDGSRVFSFRYRQPENPDAG